MAHAVGDAVHRLDLDLFWRKKVVVKKSARLHPEK
jgi:hypothetical protein